MQFRNRTRARARPLVVPWLATLLAGLLAAPAWADTPNPYTQANNTWITIDGTVDSVQPNVFTLDYGDGMVLVEMDDGDRDADAYKLLKGDKVTVSGRIDDDFFESTTIEAGSVYVENLGTTFFSSAIDEETRAAIDTSLIPPVQVSRTVVRGTVTGIDGRTFVLDSGRRMLRVDTDTMPYDPLDQEGYQKIEVGDRVKVIGEIDVNLFEGRELEADSIITLHDGN